jgi:hypothetical protein
MFFRIYMLTIRVFFLLFPLLYLFTESPVMGSSRWGLLLLVRGDGIRLKHSLGD